MNEGQKSDRGFKFILTFLTAVGTIIYTSYYYFQTSTLDDTLFRPVMAFITTLVIFSFFLITYVLINGFCPLVEDHQMIKNLIKKIDISEVDKGITLTIILIWLALSIYEILNIIFVAIGRPFISFLLFWIIILAGIFFLLISKKVLFLFSWDDIPGSDEGRLKEY
jgi:glucan phosphoethanolaminetransferase (alkaline phosphatase superfamily)